MSKLLRGSDETQILSPRKYLEGLLERMQRQHERDNPGEPFVRPSFPKLAALLSEAGYATPKGHGHWWPAQVQQLLDGRYERYYQAQDCQP